MNHGIWLPGLVVAAVGALAVIWAVRPLLPSRRCRCGDPRSAHKHYRPGTDCGLCGCGAFRRGRVRALPRHLSLGLLEDAMGRAQQDESSNDETGAGQ